MLTDVTGDFVLTESAAILVYLAERHGKLLSNDAVTRARTFEQLFAHASGLSPAFGQAGYFLKFAPEVMPHAIERFGVEANRQLGLLDTILADRAFVAGDEISIAYIAHFGWIWRRAFPDVSLAKAPNVQSWYDELIARPAFGRAIDRLDALAATSKSVHAKPIGCSGQNRPSASRNARCKLWSVRCLSFADFKLDGSCENQHER